MDYLVPQLVQRMLTLRTVLPCLLLAASVLADGRRDRPLPFSSQVRTVSSETYDEIPVDPLFTNGVQQVWRDDELLFSEAFGYASKRFNAPLTVDNRFRIGSNSKLFTAVSIYQLQEAGLLNVSDDVSLYLDASDFEAFGFPNQTEWCPHLKDDEGNCQRITFVQLMSMSSGLLDGINCNYPPGSWEIEYCPEMTLYQSYPGSVAKLVGEFINRPMSSAAGTGFHYTNENFMLCTYIVEKLSGLSFSDYIRIHITEVVGLKNTYFDPWDGSLGTTDEMLGEEYRDYHDFASTSDVSDSYYTYAICTDEFNTGSFCGTGGMVSNAPDMHLWYRNLFLERNPAILSSASIDEILFPRQQTGCTDTYCNYFCQGIGTENYIGEQSPYAIYYTGNMYCSATSMRLLTETDTEPALISIAFLNTVIVNASQSSLELALSSVSGSFYDIAYVMFGWDTYGETRAIVADLADYFRANPDAGGSGGSGDGDDNTALSEVEAILLGLALCLVFIMCVAGVYYIYSTKHNESKGGGVMGAAEANSNKAVMSPFESSTAPN